jgi:hypothetical protein
VIPVGLFRFEIARHAFPANTSSPSRIEWMREIKPLCAPDRAKVRDAAVRDISFSHAAEQ